MSDDALSTIAIDQLCRWSAVLPVAEQMGYEALAASMREVITGLEHVIVCLEPLP